MTPTKSGRETALNSNDNDDSRSVALYSDFENLHAGLTEAKYGECAYAKQDNRFKVQEPVIDVQALVELGASFGPVAINRHRQPQEHQRAQGQELPRVQLLQQPGRGPQH